MEKIRVIRIARIKKANTIHHANETHVQTESEDIMKNLLFAVISTFIIGFVSGCAYGNQTSADNLYPISTKVVSIDYTTDKVTVEQANGTIWSFYDCDDWELDDICNMIMDDNGTPEVYDDVIVDYRYSM